MTFLNGDEFNDYVTANYNQINAFAKRNKSISAVRNYLVERMAGEKIALASLSEQLDTLEDEIEIERDVKDFIEGAMISEELSFSGKEYRSPSDMMQELYDSYTKNNSIKLNKIKRAIAGNIPLDSLESGIRMYVFGKRLNRVQKHIRDNTSSSEVYSWMKDTNFPASYNDAQFVLSNEKYDKKLKTLLTENNILLNLFKE